MSLSAGYQKNFNTLRRAFRAGDAALVECQSAATGEMVAVVCAVARIPDGSVEFIPFATLFSGNPYHEINPPNPAGGFYSQEASHI